MINVDSAPINGEFFDLALYDFDSELKAPELPQVAQGQIEADLKKIEELENYYQIDLDATKRLSPSSREDLKYLEKALLNIYHKYNFSRYELHFQSGTSQILSTKPIFVNEIHQKILLIQLRIST